MATPLDDSALDTIFRKARTQNKWFDKPVSREQLAALYDLMRWGPTSANCFPVRIVFVTTPAAKERLKPLVLEGNRQKVTDAPVTAIIGYDTRFYDWLPRLFPHADARSWFWLGDRFGARNVLTIIVGYWSAMTAVTAVATGATSFMVLRFLFGVGEAGAFPGATRAMQLWYPKHERGFVQGITHSASRLGAAIAPPIVVLIMTTLGWRSVFYICGAIGFLWSALWYFAYRNLPEEHSLVNTAELAHIRGTDAKGNVNRPNIAQKPSVPWGTLLRSPNMWAIMCAYFTYVYCLWIFLSWLPSYLVEFRHFTLLKVGFLASLPLWAGVVGDTVGGLATDWLLAKSGNIKFARRMIAIVGMLGCAVFIVPAALADDAYTAVYCLTAAMFFLECTIGPSWAVPMDMGGEVSGTVSGMMNMAGNIGGALSPIVFGVLVQFGSWQAPFTASLLVIGAAVWGFWLDPSTSVVEKKISLSAASVAAG